MSLDIYLRLRAARVGRGQPRATRRHVHLAARPLVVVGYHLAGDPGAPVALRYGTTPEWSQTMVFADPGDRHLRLARFADFARDLVRHLDSFGELETGAGAETVGHPASAERGIGGERADGVGPTRSGAPQLVCPNQPTAAWLTETVARSLRRLASVAEHPADQVLARAGAHLGFLASRRGLPGSSAVLATTEVLTTHWVTGQLPVEDTHLGAVLAWVEPPDGLRGPEAAAEAELGPAVGPVSDPGWDQAVLRPLLSGVGQARQEALPDRAAAMELVAACTEALAPAWRHTWQALELVRELPEAAQVPDRWREDCGAWTQHRERLDNDSTYPPERLDELASGRVLNQLATRTAILARQMAMDDPLLMAGRVAAGEALSGEVVARDCANRVPSPEGHDLLLPVLWVRPVVPFDRPVGTRLRWVDNPAVSTRVQSVSNNGTVELMVFPAPDPAEAAGAPHAVPERLERLLPEPGERMTMIGGGGDRFPDGPPAALPWTHERATADATAAGAVA